MADGSVLALRQTAVPTEVQVVRYDFLGNEAETITFTLDDAAVVDASRSTILARGDTIVLCGNGRIHTLAGATFSEYEWGNYNTQLGFGVVHANGKFIAFLYTSFYANTGLRYSADGVTWTDTTPPYNKWRPLVFWDNTNGQYYHLSVDCYEICVGYLYKTTDFATYTQISASELSGSFSTPGVIYNDILYCPLVNTNGKAVAFASIDNGVPTEIPISPTRDHVDCSAIYVNETGSICADCSEYNYPEPDFDVQYKLNEAKTAFERQTPYTSYRTYVLDNNSTDSFVAHPTTGGYVYISVANITDGFSIVTPTTNVNIPDDSTYPWLAVTIVDGNFIAFTDFWVEENKCAELQYEYGT